MYRRYSQADENTIPLSQARRNRIRNVIILVLLAALIALAVVTIPAVQRQAGVRDLYIQRMQNEIVYLQQQMAFLKKLMRQPNDEERAWRARHSNSA